MANRASAADVVAISGSTTGITTIEIFVGVANSLINKAIADGCAINDADTLKQAEAFLAAHILISSGAGEEGGGKVKTEEKFEQWSVKYAVSKIEGDGIKSTTYGVTANMLMGGCLSDLNSEKASVGFLEVVVNDSNHLMMLLKK